MNRAKALRDLLFSKEMTFLMEAHSGMSAKIAEEAGFNALWGSGLAISAACGVRDNNELSWTQVLDILEYISDTTTIPLLLDGDTGYGNFNNMRRLVRKLEERQVAGVCIEDKLFPKTNSFIDGNRQPLADIDEFAGKIKAGKDAQSSDDFVIVARVEAFIAGWGLDEAIKRADAYHQAGADAILIHSKTSHPTEVLSFKEAWGDRCPVVIVPTKYYSTPTEVFEKAGFSAVIWANHLLRSSVSAMQRAAQRIYKEKSLVNVEENVVSVSEIFRLQGAEELKNAEKKYLPQKSALETQVLVLAASRGKELGELTKDKPKTLVPIRGKPLLDRIIGTFNIIGLKDINVVGGYKAEMLDRPNIKVIQNSSYADTGEVYSFYVGLKELSGPFLLSYGDVLAHKYITMNLLESTADITIAVDANWMESRNKSRYGEYVNCDCKHSRSHFDQRATLKTMGTWNQVSELNEGIHGEWMGLMKTSARGTHELKQALEELSHEPGFPKMRMPALFNRLSQEGVKIEVIYTRGDWFELDDFNDLVSMGELEKI